MSNDQQRYAIYFAPDAQSNWWNKLSRWLGYDAFAGTQIPQLEINGLGENLMRALTSRPSRYGVHATLKAPFRLASGHSPEELFEAVDKYASAQSRFEIPSLKAALIPDFLALIPRINDPRINQIANDCTINFDHFRAPLSENEMNRRLKEPLDTRSKELLALWGYPHVMDRYRFHISLSGHLMPEEATTVHALHMTADMLVRELKDNPLYFDSLYIFNQQSLEAPFTIIHRSRFGS